MRLYELPEVRARLLITDFLLHVARGEQDQAERLLNLKSLSAQDLQALLLRQSEFTDYSGRTFNCSAFEYAYWAKDTHMAKMLLKYMDNDTKVEMLHRVSEMEDVGLTYVLNGAEVKSRHFDFTPLQNAYVAFKEAYHRQPIHYLNVESNWLNVGKELRLVPVHVANEYCHPTRSFFDCPSFDEDTLPRNLVFRNLITENEEYWFPLPPPGVGLGFDFSLTRGTILDRVVGGSFRRGGGVVFIIAAGCADKNNDSTAIRRLDEVRTAELMGIRAELREALNPTGGCSLQ